MAAKPKKSKVDKYTPENLTEKQEEKLSLKLEEQRVIRERIISRVNRVKGKENRWRKEAREDIAFYRGEQWEHDDKTKLANEGRPCLTFNEIKPLVDVVQGYYRQNSGKLKVSPIGGEDQVFAEVFDRVVRFIDRQSKLIFKLDYCFDTGVTAGKSFFELVRSFEEDPIFGRFKFLDLGPWKIYVDDRSVEYDMSDAEWLIKECKFSKAKLKMMFPKAVKRIDQIKKDEHDYEANLTNEGALFELIESDQDNYDNAGSEPEGTLTTEGPAGSPATGKDSYADDDEMMLTLHEEWCKKPTEMWFVFFADQGNIQMFQTEELAKAADAEDMKRRQQTAALAMVAGSFDTTTPEGLVAATQKAGALIGDEAAREALPVTKNQIEKKTVPLMYVADMVGGHVIQYAKSPMLPNYNGWPIFRYIADWFPHAEEEKDRVHGIVRQVKDPQREVNKSRSSMLHITATGANSGWIVAGEQDTAEIKKLEQFGSKPGLVAREKKSGDFRKIETSAAPIAQINRETLARENIKRTAGINADLIGSEDSKSDSGRAMALRIRQAIMVLEKAFKNFRYTKELVGLAIFKMIPDMFNASTIQRIVGAQFMEANEITLGTLQGYLHLVRSGEYEVVVTDSDNSETIRQETFEALLTMAEKGLPVPPDVLLEFSPISNKKEIQGRIQAFMQQQQQAAATKK